MANIFKFKPLLKQTIWGGERIAPFKRLECNMGQVGESWEISGVKGQETVVDGGPYDGLTTNELVATLRDRLLGRDNYLRYGDEFPLLIKFIDAAGDLSVQVHPDDATAMRHGRKRGKTEMWYVMDSEPSATLMVGLKRSITPDEYKALVANGTICDAISRYNVKEGDCFYIPSGRIHSIGAGCFLTEIQQTSDVTYRIYDFKRKDKDGNFRELHTAEAADAIDYQVQESYRTEYDRVKNEPAELVDCPYFRTALYDLDEPMTLDYSELDSFVILIGVCGEGTLTCDDGTSATLSAGHTLLLPATTGIVGVSGKVKFLETYIA
ncbi:type I phosphomannose isomerase catalytic subunit [Marseilla massiliensis]|jgi:mannose-6-phosphate isomerase|uniref:type I phosphomannose isomerase catalytic subunit n=1 Tax=Marseilla massiliensis TaxID=1841864 RepID=UPI001F99462B|nr:type I phosphomannose isomerase catalytic subunit [Marseilla massiliensis]MCL1611293.1 class I mannose-6-phosphate isomerase [Marseilla massiliensis]HIV84124.1 class I mannose-6-phosphate isomerase [Candidatus Prevotella intestinigallinarum]